MRTFTNKKAVSGEADSKNKKLTVCQKKTGSYTLFLFLMPALSFDDLFFKYISNEWSADRI